MRIEKLNVFYFSPTRTTKQVVENIAKGVNQEIDRTIDFTKLAVRNKCDDIEMKNDLVIIGTPVYSGRAPLEAINFIRNLKANNTPAIIVAVFGYRAYENTLIELKQETEKVGFKVVAAGAFIGEHSFSSEQFPIAKGRPNTDDLKTAYNFGKEVREKLSEMILEKTNLNLPGTLPLPERKPHPLEIAPSTSSACTECGQCIKVCPNQAIDPSYPSQIDIKNCLKCCACVKSCPVGAKQFEHEMVQKIRAQLSELAKQGGKKYPDLFFCK